jgi:hypothetical protein
MDVKILFLVLLFLVPGVLALDIKLNIDEKIDGHMPWLNVTSFPPQKFAMTWENTGSIACRSMARIDFFREDERVYTSWGPESLLRTGESASWELYSFLNESGYNFTVTVYHCNEPFQLGPYELSIQKPGQAADSIKIVNSDANEESVNVYVMAEKDLENVVVIPADYPTGWIFESGRIESIRRGETKVVTMNYRPTLWEGAAVTFVAATEDGSYAQTKPVILRRQETDYSGIFFAILSIAIVTIYLYCKKPKIRIWKK